MLQCSHQLFTSSANNVQCENGVEKQVHSYNSNVIEAEMCVMLTCKLCYVCRLVTGVNYVVAPRVGSLLPK